MRVICLAGYYTGDDGPRIPFGKVLRVKYTVEDRGELMYEFKEYPEWGFSACAFAPLSGIDEVKILRMRKGEKKKSLVSRISTQLVLAFKSFLIL
jgi:hypothetical protein